MRIAQKSRRPIAMRAFVIAAPDTRLAVLLMEAYEVDLGRYGSVERSA
jgi:hypothetical protein